jgi:DNA polymerase sigma
MTSFMIMAVYSEKKVSISLTLIEYLFKESLGGMKNVNILTHAHVPIVKFYDPKT